MCILNFYERFLPNKATLLEPLHNMVHKGQKWNLTKIIQRIYNYYYFFEYIILLLYYKARNYLLTELTLAHYGLNKELN